MHCHIAHFISLIPPRAHPSLLIGGPWSHVRNVVRMNFAGAPLGLKVSVC